jgi:16S rRNA G966 N2-methylase RsmD
MGEIARRPQQEQLDLLSQAEGLLERASTPAELVHVSDLAATISGHAKRARAGLEAQNAAAEIHLRAQRKLGQMLETIDLSKGGRPSQQTGNTVRPVPLPTLKELGIPNKPYSQRAQLIAGWPEEDFEAFIEESKRREHELTISAAREQANRYRYAARRHVEHLEAVRRLSHLGLPERFRPLHGDFREILRGELPERQVDCILTDPPYEEEALPLWSELARAAVRHLKPGHFLIAYSGQAFLDEVMARVREAAAGELKWHWQFAARHTNTLDYRDKLIRNAYKPVLVWRKLRSSRAASLKAWEPWQHMIRDMLPPGEDTEEAKDFHEHAQPLEQATTLVEALCPQAAWCSIR